MSDKASIWIGQNGEKFGPYTEGRVRQWQREGRFGPEVLAWREGMPAWVPLAELMPPAAANEPPPPPVTGGQPRPADPAWAAAAAFPSPRGESSGMPEQRRADLPAPPSLHWLLVMLLTIVTFGLFGLIWPFVQSTWVRKVDDESHATLMLAVAMGCFVIGYGLIIAPSGSGHHASPAAAALGVVLILAYWVLFVSAYFSMARSLEDRFSRGTPAVHIGGVTLFFFNMYYLQGQLRWLARWKDTGRTTPQPPKGVLWLLWLFPAMLAILAAIAIPAYQDYIIRVQVAEGTVLAQHAESAVAAYYQSQGQLPADNASAGLSDSGPSGQYVSGIDVAGANLVVHFDQPRSNVRIRDEVLVFAAYRDADGSLKWQCGAPDTTVPRRLLPMACRP